MDDLFIRGCHPWITRVKYNSGAREKLENRKKEFQIQNNGEKKEKIEGNQQEKSIPIGILGVDPSILKFYRLCGTFVAALWWGLAILLVAL